jgi:hypothetical protein
MSADKGEHAWKVEMAFPTWTSGKLIGRRQCGKTDETMKQII